MGERSMRTKIHKLNCPNCNNQMSYIDKVGYYCEKCNDLYELDQSFLYIAIQSFIVVTFLIPVNNSLSEILHRCIFINIYLFVLIFLKRNFLKYLIKFKLIKIVRVKK